MIEVKIPKYVFEIGDKFLGDYGHEHTIIGYPKLESVDYHERGVLVGITFEYIYPVEVIYKENDKKVYRVSETELLKLTRL